MSIDASRAPSSGPQRSARRAYTSAEINKINKSDFNRERNSLLAIIATIEQALEDERERHAETRDDMNEVLCELGEVLDQVKSLSASRASDTTSSAPSSSSSADVRRAASDKVPRPDVVKIRAIKTLLGISNKKHKDTLPEMHMVFHQSRLNPRKRWDKQNINNVLSFFEAMNTISPRLARAQDNWASEYMAQQYMQNWRKNQKKPRQDVVSDDEEDRSSADNDDDDSSDDDDDE